VAQRELRVGRSRHVAWAKPRGGHGRAGGRARQGGPGDGPLGVYSYMGDAGQPPCAAPWATQVP
jgi:hypothetical protein